MNDYQRIATAIEYIVANISKQPSLDMIAAEVNLSPYHFQRLFSRWAGVTPKRFLQTLTLEKAKQSLRQMPEHSLLETSDHLGLSSGSRLYDHFIKLEAVTPAQFKSAGEGVTLYYGFHETRFGPVFLAETERGVVQLSFAAGTEKVILISCLQQQWPQARIVQNQQQTANTIERIFSVNTLNNKPLSLQVQGTNFQVNVWRALLNIPTGDVTSYSAIAQAIGKPKAVRAVGSAVGANPIALLIPCHRVLRNNGALGGYRWGLTRKHAILAWEAAMMDQNNKPE